jgi:apolipoprotein N-acyltransferase
MPFLVALTIWGAVASGLLIERLRRREATHFSGKAFGLLWLVFLGAIGALFAWVGLETSSTLGLMLMLAGLFLSLVAVFAFAFKLVDLAFRRISRGIRKRPR